MTDKQYLKCPFPYFGGKSTVADVIWEALGDVAHYIEPFCGSSAVLLGRPNGLDLPVNYAETINDIDGMIANVWRCLKYKAEETADYADDIVCHVDLYAKRQYLNKNYGTLLELLKSDPEACNPKMAGYYIWAASCWIGAGLIRKNAGIKLVSNGSGINKLSVQRPQLSFDQGINKVGIQIPDMSRHGTGINAAGKRPLLAHNGQGVNTNGRRPHLSCNHGVNTTNKLSTWFTTLQSRLKRVRITNGDWKIVLGGNWQDAHWGTVGLFLDPPYSNIATRDDQIYTHDSMDVSHEVREYCIKQGVKPNWRIVIAGYIEEHQELLNYGWTVYRWKSSGGFSNTSTNKESKGKSNRKREALFMSPACNRNNELFIESYD